MVAAPLMSVRPGDSACVFLGFATWALSPAAYTLQSMLRSFAGKSPIVPASCYIDPSAQLLGDVVLGEESSVWLNAVIRGDVHHIRLGDRTNVQDNATLHGQRNLHPVIVGSGVTIGHNAIVHGCTVEDDVLIGMGAILLNGCHIGRESIIAAGCLVPEGTVIPPRSLVAGLPGKVRRSLTDADVDLIRMYARNYLDYRAAYLADSGTPPK